VKERSSYVLLRGYEVMLRALVIAEVDFEVKITCHIAELREVVFYESSDKVRLDQPFSIPRA
jgi:hypothetical protein